MDALTLTIESHAVEDLETEPTCDVTARSIRIGRKAGNDWVLPDPTRHISGHHLDIRFADGAYMVHDLSINGTFLNGSKERIADGHVIADGDRLQVGPYVMYARLREMERPFGPTNVPSPGAKAAIQTRPLTQSGQPVQAPPGAAFMDNGPKPGVQAPGSGAGSSAQAAQTPDFTRFRSNISTPPTGARPSDPLGDAPAGGNDVKIPDDDFTHDLPKPNADGPFVDTPAAAKPTIGAELSKAPRGFGESFSDPTPAPVAPQPQPAETTPAPDANAAMNDFLAGFLEGAEIDDAAALQIPLRDLGRMLGQCARMGTREMMQMLQDRSAVKLFVAQEDRTMRVASGNNPMKFMLDPDQAFETMFVTPRDGYQTGPDGFDNALTDIRKHQMAMMAAVQPAMADMLEGLAPKDIEAAAGGGGGMLGSGARKCWDEYNKRWTTRADQGENGMLDAFVDAFARRYSEALASL